MPFVLPAKRQCCFNINMTLNIYDYSLVGKIRMELFLLVCLNFEIIDEF